MRQALIKMHNIEAGILTELGDNPASSPYRFHYFETYNGAPISLTINLNGRTRLYPLLGDPIIYARSPDWLSKRMAERGMNFVSLPMEVPDGALDAVMTGLAATKNVDGVSLTVSALLDRGN